MSLPPPAPPPAPNPLGEGPHVIEAQALSKTFDGVQALRDIDLTVPAGTVVGLIGPSGCGKTTLVRIMAGIVRPSSGSLTVLGSDPATFRPRQRARIGYMPQQPVLFPNLSVWGNLSFVASLYGLRLRGRRSRLHELLDLVDMGPHRKKLLSECSGGMQRRVSLAATLLHDPELVLLDEPTAGVDPILRERFWTHFGALRDQGKTVVVPTQYVGEAVSCDLVAVMAAGRLITLQTPEALPRFAFGGDPLDIRLDRGWLGRSEIDRLVQSGLVSSVQRTDDGLLVVVDRADTGVAQLRRHFAAAGIEVGGIEPPELNYDQVFVQLVERHTDATERAAA